MDRIHTLWKINVISTGHPTETLVTPARTRIDAQQSSQLCSLWITSVDDTSTGMSHNTNPTLHKPPPAGTNRTFKRCAPTFETRPKPTGPEGTGTERNGTHKQQPARSTNAPSGPTTTSTSLAAKRSYARRRIGCRSRPSPSDSEVRPFSAARSCTILRS